MEYDLTRVEFPYERSCSDLWCFFFSCLWSVVEAGEPRRTSKGCTMRRASCFMLPFRYGTTRLLARARWPTSGPIFAAWFWVGDEHLALITQTQEFGSCDMARSHTRMRGPRCRQQFLHQLWLNTVHQRHELLQSVVRPRLRFNDNCTRAFGSRDTRRSGQTAASCTGNSLA